MGNEWTHFDLKGNARMVDVSEKASTMRQATASGMIRVNEAVMQAVNGHIAAKGDVLGVARVAGIMAVKRTAELIPMCHTIPIEKCDLIFYISPEELTIQAECTVTTEGKTGVEMEALTGVNIALLTIYDMCKAMDRGMVISEVCLLKKSGGKSGVYERENERRKDSGKIDLL